jgi:hypothetical protein
LAFVREEVASNIEEDKGVHPRFVFVAAHEEIRKERKKRSLQDDEELFGPIFHDAPHDPMDLIDLPIT